MNYATNGLVHMTESELQEIANHEVKKIVTYKYCACSVDISDTNFGPRCMLSLLKRGRKEVLTIQICLTHSFEYKHIIDKDKCIDGIKKLVHAINADKWDDSNTLCGVDGHVNEWGIPIKYYAIRSRTGV